jgi:hypothetical protein
MPDGQNALYWAVSDLGLQTNTVTPFLTKVRNLCTQLGGQSWKNDDSKNK